ncbi:uncharacterized protein LOC134701608 [Mytilus trossulus]|uniref:uncharacterized protein LOC134701608 n=1 Tax=Mytilus trossulus TaxID=6551 RepID=UPI0030065C45
MLNDVFIEAVKAEKEMIRNVAGMKSSCQCFQITETEDFVRKPECRQGCIMCMDYGNLKFSCIIDRKYWFSWRTNNKKNFKFITEKGIIQQKCSTINVQLDLLPAYEVISTDKQQDAREKHHNCFLVPKTCIEKEHTKCWRISRCLTEIRTLQNTSLCHWNVYRTLKYLLLVLLDICDIKSFHIKNIILHHIGECKSNSNVEKCLCETIDELVSCIEKGEMPFWSISGIHMEPFHSDHMYFKRKADFDRSFYSEILRLTKQVIGKKQLYSSETDYKLQTPDGTDIALSKIIGNSIFQTANHVIRNELNVEQYLLEMATLGESNEDFYSYHIEQEEDYEKVRIDPGTVDFSRTIFTESP